MESRFAASWRATYLLSGSDASDEISSDRENVTNPLDEFSTGVARTVIE